MQRAQSHDNIITQTFNIVPFEDDWRKAFGNPAYGRVWFIWGDSGSGKSSFAMQLFKQFCLFGNKCLYNTLEEFQTKSFQDRIKTFNMVEVRKSYNVVKEQIPDLAVRLRRERSADVIFIDSPQYLRIRKEKLMDFLEEFSHKTIVFVSQSENGKERGQLATDIHFEAYMKIYIDKYVAYFKGREKVPDDGTGEFVSYPEMAEKLGYKKSA
jgi:archaellum biogenesis ATPase FlaH